jgi:hypothetical protein
MRLTVAGIGSIALACIPASPAHAQETPAEREAARAMLDRMSALEHSLDVSGLVARLTGSDAERDRSWRAQENWWTTNCSRWPTTSRPIPKSAFRKSDPSSHTDYRAAVKKEFDGIKALFSEYQTALKKVYTVPAVSDPK